LPSRAACPPLESTQFVNESRGITTDTALCLSRYFSTTSKFWMNLQRDYDLRTAARSSRAEIEQSVQPRSAA
jgi:addiction module HigA family antidote